MPMQRHLYPPNWEAISRRIRVQRAKGRCECTGECGSADHRDTDGRCTEENGKPAEFFRGKVILTVAHLNHDLADNREENLKAMCQRCHLRLDRHQHAASARETRRKRLAARELF